MAHRRGEDDTVRFRSERAFCVNDRWFFLTRESVRAVGPFKTKVQVLKAVQSYTEDMKAGLSSAQAMSHIRIVSDSYLEDKY